MSRGGGQRNAKRLAARAVNQRAWYRRILFQVLKDIRDAAAAEGITVGEATADRAETTKLWTPEQDPALD